MSRPVALSEVPGIEARAKDGEADAEVATAARPVPAPASCRPPGNRVVRDCSILLLDADRPHSRKVEKVLRSMVANVEVAPSLASVSPDAPRDLLVVNYESLPEAERAALFHRHPHTDPMPRLFIHSGGTSREELGVLFSQHGLTNLLAKADAESEEFFITVQKILRRDIFGLEKYFPWGAESLTMTIRDSTQRFELLERLGQAAESVGVHSRFVEQLRVVADELSTNALYDAPVDAAGASRFASLPRTTDVLLEPGEDIVVTFCCDGRRLGLSVRDPFGSLRVDKVLYYLTKCFKVGADQIDTKEGGAGLGLYFTFEALSHFIINMRPGAATEMIGLLDVRGSYKDFAVRGKSFNVFVST